MRNRLNAENQTSEKAVLPGAKRRNSRRLIILLVFLFGAAAVAIVVKAVPLVFPERALQNASLSTLISLSRQQPKSGRIFYYLGLKFNEIGYPRAAYNTLKHAALLSPDDAQICIAYAATSRPKDDGKTAVHALTDFLARHPDNIEVKYTLSGILWQSRNYEMARALLLDVLKKQPDNAEAWYRYGATLSSPERQSEEVEAYERAVGLEPDNILYRVDLAGIQSQMQKVPEAEKNYRLALAQAPDDATVCAALGRFLAQQGSNDAKKAEGERLLSKALQIEPENLEAQYDLGNALLERGDFKGAIPHLEQVTAKQSDEPDGWFALARACQRNGDTGKAEAALKRAQQLRTAIVARNEAGARVRQNPNDPQLRVRLARLYVKQGASSDALEQYSAAVKLAPSDKAIITEAKNFATRLQSGSGDINSASPESMYIPTRPTGSESSAPGQP